jgi:uncharacterized protein YdaT
MARVKYRVSQKDDGRWQVKRDGASRASNVFDNKANAVKRGSDLARAQPLGQVFIYKQHGGIQTEHTYGNDPKNRKG